MIFQGTVEMNLLMGVVLIMRLLIRSKEPMLIEFSRICMEKWRVLKIEI